MATVVDVLLQRHAIAKAFGDDRSVKGFERLQEIVSEAPDLITLAQNTATDAQTKVNGLKASVQFLTLNTTGLLSAERALVGTAGQISLTDGGAGGNATLALVDTAVAAGSYGDATHVGAFTVDAKGRLTSASSVPISFPASGATAFTGLSDVPASYSGQSLKAVRVNAGETALEFYTPSGGGGGDLLSTNNLSDLANAGTALTNLGLSANGKSLVTAANYAAMRTALGLVIGTDVQAYNANLTTYAGIAPSANVQTLLGAANYAAFRSSLSIGAIGLLSTVTEADQTLADNTTNNATTGRHGYLKKLSNVATEYMDGTGAWSTPAGGGSSPTEYGVPVFRPNALTSSAINFAVVVPFLVPVGMTLNSVKVYCQTTGASTVIKPVIYSDVSGSPSALLASGSAVTGVVYGITKLPLTSGLAVTKGQLIWVGITVATAAFPGSTAINIPNAFFAAASGTPPNPASGVTVQTTNNIVCWASTDT